MDGQKDPVPEESSEIDWIRLGFKGDEKDLRTKDFKIRARARVLYSFAVWHAEGLRAFGLRAQTDSR